MCRRRGVNGNLRDPITQTDINNGDASFPGRAFVGADINNQFGVLLVGAHQIRLQLRQRQAASLQPVLTVLVDFHHANVL